MQLSGKSPSQTDSEDVLDALAAVVNTFVLWEKPWPTDAAEARAVIADRFRSWLGYRILPDDADLARQIGEYVKWQPDAIYVSNCPHFSATGAVECCLPANTSGACCMLASSRVPDRQTCSRYPELRPS